jgi:hypothetical protein
MSKESEATQLPELRTFRIERRTTPSERYDVIGRLVVGIPRAEYLKLVEEYPPNPVSQVADRRVDEAIQAKIGDRQLARLRAYMGLAEYADIRIEAHWLNVLASDYLGRKPAFENQEDGSKFWVDRQ